jgi:hypothetical protein
MTESDARPSWSRRRRLAIAVVAVALAAGSYLVGSGRVPWGGGSDAVSGDWSAARVMASDTSDGVAAGVEVAPAAGAPGTCVRVELAAGETVATAESCGADLPWVDPGFEVVRLSDRFGSIGEIAVRDGDRWRVALHGAVHPDVTRVNARFGDGGEYSFVTRGADGWFVSILPVDVADPDTDDGHLVNPLVRLELFDDEGTRLASVNLP